MTFNQEQDYWAGYKANERALIIQTWSGFGRYALDHLYPPHILPLDTDNETLGMTVLQRHDGLTSIGEQQDFCL